VVDAVWPGIARWNNVENRWWVQVRHNNQTGWMAMDWLEHVVDGGNQGGGQNMTLSPQGSEFTRLSEGHDHVLPNGNFRVIYTPDNRLTTFRGLIVGQNVNGVWEPRNNFTQQQVDNRDNGIDPDVWLRNFNVFQRDSLDAVNNFANRNGVRFTQYQFDAMMDFAWLNGHETFYLTNPNGTYFYDFMNYLIEPGFLTNATPAQRERFESSFGNNLRRDGVRVAGMWVRRMTN